MTLQLYINVYLFDPYSRKEEVIIIENDNYDDKF